MEKLNQKSSEKNLSKTLNGWTWGNLELNEKSIKMTSQDKEWFTINGSQITNVTNQNKNELGLEFCQDDEGKDG